LSLAAEQTNRITTLWDAKRSAVQVLLIRIGGAGLAYASQVMLARLMGKAEYGIFATVWVWIAILGHGLTLGFPQAACRFLPEHLAKGEPEYARGFLRYVSLIVMFCIILGSCIGVFLVWFLQGYIEPVQWVPFLLMFMVVPFFAMQDYVEGLARSFNWAVLAIAPIYLLRQGLFACGTALAIVLGAPAVAATAILAMIGATVAALLLQGFILKRRINTVLQAGEPRANYPLWLGTAAPIAFSNIMFMFLSYVDVLLVSFFSSPEAVAVYFAATRILQFMNFVQYAATAATAQRFSEAQARGDRVTLQDLLVRTARWNTFATFIVGIGLMIVATFLLQLFGKGFGDAVPLLLVLMIGTILQTIAGPAEDALMMLGAERLAAKANFIFLILAVALHCAVIPVYGIWGASCIAAFLMVSRNVFLAIIAQNRLGLATHIFKQV
jgi:O-antigen/teichoic acid export membrane protein